MSLVSERLEINQIKTNSVYKIKVEYLSNYYLSELTCYLFHIL